MKMIVCVALLTVIVGAAGVGTCAAEKPVVAVRFRVQAATYKGHFSNLNAVEALVTKNLILALKQNISFMDFAAEGDAPRSYLLTVAVDVPDESRQVATQKVWLFSSLTPLGGSEPKSRWQWVKYRDPLSECFDTSDSACRLPNDGEFSDDLNVLLAAANYSELVKNVLRDVPILTGQGKLLVQPVAGWVLPFRPTEICMDLQSQFRVAGSVPSPAATIPGTFLAEMEGPYKPSPDAAVFGMLLRGESDDDDRVKKPIFLQNPDAAVVTAVYVAQYRRPPGSSCGGAIPPSSTGDGGAQ